MSRLIGWQPAGTYIDVNAWFLFLNVYGANVKDTTRIKKSVSNCSAVYVRIKL